MVHLISHIIGEIKACGPVFLRYMYLFKRYMGVLKGYVRNQYRPEGSIIKGYASEEVIDFFTDYLNGVKNIDPKDSKWNIVLHGKRHIVGVENVEDEEEYDQFDELPPFLVGIPSSNVDIDNTTYLRSDHNEGL
ncbi:hypothetical protein OSB04_031181 [Centaurea solstitialis]|uniref:DUF4218 domain-containing protein n=1 Tax=Centaurea solstitialis TaxID=347529 RepID=A0AA38SU74_9ASTR|nr:hypothetical protein OSB04_031181 [Centaurea solstitialis]